MANALVVQKVQLPQSQLAVRAAQYVRMSTDYQRYSIENQAAVIAAYANLHGLSIVATYRDAGESGLGLKRRKGLIQLLDDVQGHRADYGHILVYDVSRWGRFQDTDESAHYEFICKQAGIRVCYCAEQFDNDGTMLSSIMKNLKRVMAAEYSRELSAKVYAGAARFARLGFVIGGRASYGLQRQLVNERSEVKAILKKGQRKYLQTDHVKLSPGSMDEISTVKWIFEQFLKDKSETAIAGALNRAAVPSSTGRPWNRALIGRLLRNENYIGNVLYNRHSSKLGAKRVANKPSDWIRSEGCVEPMIERSVFLQAQKIIEERRVDLSEDEMLKRLRKALLKNGELNPTIINNTVGLPCVKTYMDHFGTIRNAYSRIGYTSKRNLDYFDGRQRWIEEVARHTIELCDRLRKGGCHVVKSGDCLRVNSTVAISLQIARWCPGKRTTHVPYWTIQRRDPPSKGWVVAIRLGERNSKLLDYLLMPTSAITGRLTRFSDNVRAKREIANFERFPLLVRSLIRRVATPKCSAPAKSHTPKRQRRSAPTKTRAARRRH
jgi:DNA invertase Pin-like site-specific DNA recombinase